MKTLGIHDTLMGDGQMTTHFFPFICFDIQNLEKMKISKKLRLLKYRVISYIKN